MGAHERKPDADAAAIHSQAADDGNTFFVISFCASVSLSASDSAAKFALRD